MTKRAAQPAVVFAPPHPDTNPTPSPVTRAYLDAKDVVGLPETERERLLFGTLQDVLERLHDPSLHGGCVGAEDHKDTTEELERAETQIDELEAQVKQLEGALNTSGKALPEATVNLDDALLLCDELRLRYDAGGSRTFEEDRRLEAPRRATALLRELVIEVRAWRAAFPLDTLPELPAKKLKKKS